METQVLGLSVDSVPSLKAWADSLGGIEYPLLSDFYPHGEVSQRFGVLRTDGRSERAIFIIDRQGIIRYVDVHDISQQPDNDELFRVLSEVTGIAVPKTQAVTPIATDKASAVMMYCTPWCPDCRVARVWLKENHVEYVEVDISRDREAAGRVREWANGAETTPTFNINGAVLIDPPLKKLAELLESGKLVTVK
jgi:glutaredoxin